MDLCRRDAKHKHKQARRLCVACLAKVVCVGVEDRVSKPRADGPFEGYEKKNSERARKRSSRLRAVGLDGEEGLEIGG